MCVTVKFLLAQYNYKALDLIMENDEITWLHISDLHFKSDGTYDRNLVTSALLKSIPDLVRRAKQPHFIVVTGDLAYSGQVTEYKAVGEFFDQLIARLNLTKTDLIVVPGNHDVDRSKGKGLVRHIHNTEDLDEYFDPSEPLPHIIEKQRNFVNWYDQYFDGIRSFSKHTTCQPVTQLQYGQRKVALLQINSAIFSAGDDDHEKLSIGRRCITNVEQDLNQEIDVLKIAVMHHPLSWINAGERANIKSIFDEKFDLILSGHLHEPNADLVENSNGQAIYISAGAAYQTRKYPNTAMFGTYSGRKVELLPIRYEDQPREVWSIDTSIYPKSAKFTGKFELETPQLSHEEVNVSFGTNETKNFGVFDNDTTFVSREINTSYEENLFVTPAGKTLYVEPRVMNKPQGFSYNTEGDADEIQICDIVSSNNSFVIESRVEYGGTTLCRRLLDEFSLAGKPVFNKDAVDLPKYQKKLETIFPKNIQMHNDAVLILDNFSAERDERLLNSLYETNWFSRVIAVTRNHGVIPNESKALENVGFEFSQLHLWPLSRQNIRTLAEDLFDSSDDFYITGIVDKVYSDLVGLCIPLTPANAVMYLRVLFKEGEFHPLNRVDIIGSYVKELLKKPDELYLGSFNTKNKINLLSAFVFKLYKDDKSDFDDGYWYGFAKEYQQETLNEFDANGLLAEYIDARIFVRWNGCIFLKYSFFFDFFLGSFIASRHKVLEEFLSQEEFLGVPGVIDVITSLGSDNSEIIGTLIRKLENCIEEVLDKHLVGGFDPLSGASWPSHKDEEFWKNIASEVESGRNDLIEIDKNKTQPLSEFKSLNQKPRISELREVERIINTVSTLLSDSIKNSDNISGKLKLEAIENIYLSWLICFQIGTVLSPFLARFGYVQWGGVAFIGFNKIGFGDDDDLEKTYQLMVPQLSRAISNATAKSIGISKLSAVFSEREKRTTTLGYVDVLNFCCVLNAKGSNWATTLKSMIERADKNSYFLFIMLDALVDNFKNEINLSKNRDELKNLIAFVRAKRIFNKNSPGARGIKKVLKKLEERQAFDQVGN